MGFHYGLERKKFDANFAEFRQQCLSAGMSEADIEAMHEFDWSQFKQERCFRMHTQPLDGLSFSDGDLADESKSPLFHHFQEALSSYQGEISTWGREAWIEDLDSSALIEAVKSLSEEDIELLSCMIADGLTQAEIARKIGVSRAAVCKKIARIRMTLEKSLNKS